jgi:uracil-DNA glycosylase family 4
MPNYVAGEGPFEPKLMIIGEAPGKNENEAGRPFVGASGAELERWLFAAGISRSEVYITNVVKYQPPFNDLKKLHLIDVDLNEQIDSLWKNEIKVYRPNCILAVGNLALEATTGLSGILKWRGSILLSRDRSVKVVPTIHPAALMNRYESGEQVGGLDYCYTKLCKHDVQRAVIESETDKYEVPYRQLDVITNSLELYRFSERYKDHSKVAADIESINCIPVCVGFAFNSGHAVSVPLLKQLGKYSLTDMSYQDLCECWKIVDEILKTKKVIGQNFKYDEFKLSRFGFRIPTVYSDTLIKTRVIFPELPAKDLGTIASLWTREPYYKDEGKEFKIGKSNISQLLLYNARDCAVEYEVDEAQEKDLIGLQDRYQIPLVSYYYDYMMKKHKFYLEMENVGFNVDHKRKAELRDRYTILERNAHIELSTLLGREINVKSPPQIFDLLYKELKFPFRKKAPTAEDSLVALMQSHCKGKDGPRKKQILETILEERRIRDQKSRYINFTPDYDNRCKTSFNISATETCRSSTSTLKKPIRPKTIGLAFHTISKHGRLAKDIRSMFIPDDGKVFIQADSSQAEARVVAVLSKDFQLLQAFDTIDIHRRTAGLIFGIVDDLILTTERIPIVDDIEKDSPTRFAGKKVRHAGNYNMGKRRFMQEFNTDAQKFEINMDISEWKAGQMLDKFHAASPNLRGVFHREIEEALNETRTIIDPFGGIRIFNGRMEEDLYKEGYANIPQRTVAHLVQGAALRVREQIGRDNIEARFILEAHDALLMQVPANDWEPYARLLKKEMETPIDFSQYCTLKRDYQLVIPAAIEFSDTNYGDLKAVKLSEVTA